jgi:hypothetical protein
LLENDKRKGVFKPNNEVLEVEFIQEINFLHLIIYISYSETDEYWLIGSVEFFRYCIKKKVFFCRKCKPI